MSSKAGPVCLVPMHFMSFQSPETHLCLRMKCNKKHPRNPIIGSETDSCCTDLVSKKLVLNLPKKVNSHYLPSTAIRWEESGNFSYFIHWHTHLVTLSCEKLCSCFQWLVLQEVFGPLTGTSVCSEILSSYFQQNCS